MKLYLSSIDKKTINEIGKFSILWAMFEKKCCSVKVGCNNFNYNVLCDVFNKIELDSISVNLLREEIIDRMNNVRKTNIDEYIDKYLHPDGSINSGKAMRTDIKDFINNEGENINRGCLTLIYRIRNNLLHGLKGEYELNSQYKMFLSINKVLETLEIRR